MIKKLIKVFLVAGALTSTFPLMAAAREGVVRGSYINLRQEAKFNSPIIGKKMRGDSYKILFEEKNWLKVSFADGTEGWLYKTLIEQTGEPPAKPAKEPEAGKAEVTPEKKEDDKKAAPVKAKSEIKIETKKTVVAKPVAPKVKPAEVVEVSGTAEELYNEAIQLYEKKKFAEALEKNQLAIQKAPQNAEIMNNIGNCQFKLGRIEEALESWKNAMKIAPRSGKICNNLGIAYYQLDKNKDAIEYYKKAILFEPEFPDPYYNLASVYGFTGNFADAIVNYRKFLEFSPDATMKKLAEERIAYCERHIDKPAGK
ncbi:MAG: tetratricopeptide repeat protein [Candidatus Riflebacteria bacterium]|nr:tetratricopeptide repeat protein [Candidatus Riflebacteria bacterium]